VKLADKLNAGETILTAWSTLASTGVVELLARADFDAVTLDMQHGAHTEESVHDGLLAIAASDKGAIVRIPVGRNDMVSRALDFGAEACDPHGSTSATGCGSVWRADSIGDSA
jgi:4-hydroxy-2-oxoheptanedioate aldolase